MISSIKKEVFTKASSVFGGVPSVNEYWDDRHKSRIDVLCCPDVPQVGVNSYSTIGLSEVPNSSDLSRAEICGASNKFGVSFANVISTAAFSILNDGLQFKIGSALKNCVGIFDSTITVPNLLFVDPFVWDSSLILTHRGIKVKWLLAVPISNQELHFFENRGLSEMEDLFEREGIDIFDLYRPSVV